MIIWHILILLAIALLAAAATSKVSVKRWGGSFPKLCTIGCLLTVLATAGSFLFRGLGMHNIQAIFLCCVFLYASYGDIKTHEADDFVHIIVLAVALIGKPATAIPEALLSAAVMVGVMLLVTVLVPGAGIGGADMRFCAACAFLATFSGSLLGLGLGTFAALLGNSPFRKKKAGAGEEDAVALPMLPYLSCSYMLVYLLSL